MKPALHFILFIKKKLCRLFSFSYIPMAAKLFLCYLFLASMMFVFLNTYGNTAMHSKLIKDQEARLYTVCSALSRENTLPETISATTIAKAEPVLSFTASLADCRIWTADPAGLLCFDSGTPNRTGSVIPDFDENFLTETTVHDTTVHNLLPYHACAVIYPLTNDFQITGYLIAFYPVSNIETESVQYTDVYNICLIFYGILLAFVFLVLFFLTVPPLKKNIKALQSFSSGKYEDRAKIHTRDEYEELADTAAFLAMELKNSEDYQKKFIANISHDLRSPLTSIKGYAEAMADGTIPPELQDKYLNIIIYEAARLSKLSQSLLTLNNYENRGAMLQLSVFDINSIIRQTALSFEGTGRRKGIQIHLLFEEPSLFVSADMPKIEQVLYNLLDNAIKFSYENKTIRITTKSKGSKAIISIKDNGIGIPKESLHKVFDRFYKTDSSRGRDKKGAGLGLAITKEIISTHKEHISVVSTEGAGTEFTFSLSLSPK